MLTECPSCQTRYEVADRLLRRRGRRIRCAACQGSWILLPPQAGPRQAPEPQVGLFLAAPVGSGAPPVAPPLSPITGSRVAPQPERRWLPPVAFSAALLRAGGAVAVLGSLMLALGLREAIVRHVPQTGAAYAALGLPVNLRGLEFRDIKSSLVTDEGRRLLAVEGVIAQVGRREAQIPDLRLAVRDASGREIYSWTTPAPRQKLARGETAFFRARLSAPPPAGTQVRVQFAEASR